MHVIFDSRGPLDVSTSPADGRVVVHLLDTGTGDRVDIVLDSPDAEIRLGHQLRTDGRAAKTAQDRLGEQAITRAMSARREKIVNDPFLPETSWTAEG